MADTRIDDIVLGLLAKRSFAGTLDPGLNLNEAGLTSMDMVNLMLAIESAFDIEIPQDQMKPENFRSVLAIQALVSSVASC